MAEPRARTWTDGIPPALLIALVAQVGLGGILAAIESHVFSQRSFDGDVTRWLAATVPLAWRGLVIAATALMIASYLDLSRRVPRAQAPVMVAGAVALGLLLVTSLVWIYLLYYWVPADRDRLEHFETIARWMARARMTFALLASGALIAAGWSRREVRLAAAPLLLLTAAVFPPVWLWKLLNFADLSSESSTQRWLQLALDSHLRAAWAGVTLFVAGAVGQAVPSPAGWVRAGRGMHLAGSALIARVIVAAAVAVLTLVLISTRSGALGSAMVWLVPAGIVGSLVALSAGLVQAGGAGAEGAPRLRLYLAAGLLTWTAVIQVIQGTVAYGLLRSRLDGDPSSFSNQNEAVVQVFHYATPLVALAGLLLALAAAAALRRRLGAPPDGGEITTAGVLVTASTLAVIVLQKWMRTGVETQDGFLFATILIAVATVVGQLAVARVLQRTGATMAAVPELPVATVADR